MTLLDEMHGQAGAGTRPQGGGASGGQAEAAQYQEEQQVNVGQSERAVSVAAGSILAMLGVSRRSIPGLLIAGVGAAMVQRGLSGHCSVYSKLGLDTTDEGDERQRQRDDRDDLARNGIHVEQAFLINKPAEELYDFWHNFSNLPSIMKHLKSVTVDGNRSHWVAEAPTIAGGTVEWDAEITRDEPGKAIAWQSLPGSQVQSAGEVRFRKALGDRGTEVHVYMNYRPPAGKLGHYIATMFGESPRRQMREDIRNFKRLMECGEIVTTVGQPVGTCLRSGGSRSTT
jgi:uncharacterized membrane protein